MKIKDMPSFEKLQETISKLEKYGKDLSLAGDPEKGLTAVHLATKLFIKTGRLGQFELDRQEDLDNLRANLDSFKRDFKEVLHSEDKTMNAHRSWKPLLANIALACTIVGAFALGIKYACTGSGFFKTKRQKQAETIGEIFERTAVDVAQCIVK